MTYNMHNMHRKIGSLIQHVSWKNKKCFNGTEMREMEQVLLAKKYTENQEKKNSEN